MLAEPTVSVNCSLISLLVTFDNFLLPHMLILLVILGVQRKAFSLFFGPSAQHLFLYLSACDSQSLFPLSLCSTYFSLFFYSYSLCVSVSFPVFLLQVLYDHFYLSEMKMRKEHREVSVLMQSEVALMGENCK